MVEALGLVVSKTEIQTMVKEADTDGSGEIEFTEFVQAMAKQEERMKEAKNAESLASLVTRQQKSVKMTWRETNIGKDVIVDREKKIVSRQGDGFGVAVLDPLMPDDNKRNRGSAIFEVSEVCFFRKARQTR